MPYLILALGVTGCLFLLGCLALAAFLVIVELAAAWEARRGHGESA